MRRESHFSRTAAIGLRIPCPQAFELRLWPEQHPLRQFEQQLSYELLRKLEDRQLDLDTLAVSQRVCARVEGGSVPWRILASLL